MQFLNDMSSNFWQIVGFISAIMVALSAFMYYRADRMERDREKKVAALEGTIENKKRIPNKSKKAQINSDYVFVDFGSNIFSYKKESLKNGIQCSPITIGIKYPIFLKIKNDSLFVSATINSRDGKVVAEIIDNEWKINPNNYFKRNYDKHGFEVVDQESILKLQVYFTGNDSIKIGGVFMNGKNRYSFISPFMLSSLAITDLNDLKNYSSMVPNIFKYPEGKYFGIREDIKMDQDAAMKSRLDMINKSRNRKKK